jgi:hypothetical protein
VFWGNPIRARNLTAIDFIALPDRDLRTHTPKPKFAARQKFVLEGWNLAERMPPEMLFGQAIQRKNIGGVTSPPKCLIIGGESPRKENRGHY